MLVEASNLTQTMLSWVSGCAVIDWVCAALPVFYSDPLPANMAAVGGPPSSSPSCASCGSSPRARGPQGDSETTAGR